MRSLDGAGGTLVDAGTAVDTGVGVDDRDIADGDCVRGTSVCACSACDTICFFDCRHFNNLWILVENRCYLKPMRLNG